MKSFVPRQYISIIKGVLYDHSLADASDVKNYISAQTQIPVSELEGKSRPAHVALSRQIGMFGLRTRFQLQLKQIGKEFGDRDHGTVIHADRTVRDYLQYCTGEPGKELYEMLATYEPPQTTNEQILSYEFRRKNPHLAQEIKSYPSGDITALLDAMTQDQSISTKDISSTIVLQNQLVLDL